MNYMRSVQFKKRQLGSSVSCMLNVIVCYTVKVVVDRARLSVSPGYDICRNRRHSLIAILVQY